MPTLTLNNHRAVVALLVEDNANDIFMIREVLKHSKYAIHLGVVNNGSEALSYLHHEGEYVDTAEPDLLLLDLNLPKIDGWKVLTEIKQDPHLNCLPVLLVSSTWRKEDEERAHELKADNYLVKPLDMAHFPMLIQAVEKVIAA